MEHIGELKNMENKNPTPNIMNLLLQAPNEDKSKEFFIQPQNPNYNDNGRLESNREDLYSHTKIL
jgi:hypothetical protein